ncbi:MAG: class I SAM-dependent methyltransferase [Verrucomicrobia bacterium]|nr:class I SAM-dependent methyltransferase [Verrucomicrobiota bacterium]
MFSVSAEYYDLVYGNKDYQGETDRLRGLFRRFVPEGRTILDIACGTGEHLRLLPEYQVAGIDLEPTFVRIANEKRPDGNFQIADMQQFDLGTKFDILICLFSAIAYLLTPEAILSALGCFKAHLAAGGAIFIEPFFERKEWHTGRAHITSGEDDHRKVCRLMTSDREGDVSILIGHYLIAEGIDVRYAVERHELLLLDRDQWQDFFREAGLSAKYLPEAFSSRGLYVARPFPTAPASS